MLIKISVFTGLKKLTGTCLIFTFFCLCSNFGAYAAKSSLPDEPSYVVTPELYRDTYMLTQLFYASFHLDDLDRMREMVSRGMLAYPADFPRFMALTLELAKKPDSRLFMLLAPLAAHMADPDNPADLASVIELTRLMSPLDSSSSSLRERIKFYEDDSVFLPPPGEKPFSSSHGDDPSPPRPEANPSRDNNLSFVRFNGGLEAPQTRFTWTRELPGGQLLLIEAVDSVLPNGVTWGGVRSIMPGTDDLRMDFFSVAEGIISFASPADVSANDFYADETARSYAKESPERGTRGKASGIKETIPCEMGIRARLHGTGVPPALTLELVQTNAGPEGSDFLCRAQCVLTYEWDGLDYSLSGKACTQSGWGEWPYSDEKYRELGRAYLP